MASSSNRPSSPVTAATAPQRLKAVSRFPADRLGDAELVEAIAHGDVEAMGAVWDRYSPLLRGILRGSFGPDEVVDDLLQEVFVVLLRCASEVRDPNALRAFLVSVTVRLTTVEFRRRKVRRWVSLSPNGDMPDSSVSPTDFAGTEILRALYRILDSMSARRRMAFVLRHVHGLEVGDVASAMRVSESTAKRDIAHACDIVRRRSKSEPSLWQYLQEVEKGGHA